RHSCLAARSVRSVHRGAVEEPAELVEQAGKLLLVLVREVAKQLDDPPNACSLVVQQGLLAGVCQTDVDLALIAGVDAAADEWAITGLQGADDARHLGRQHAEEPLDVADDHGAVRLEEAQRQVFDLLEIAGTPPAAQGGQAELADDLEEGLRDLID